MVTFMKKTNVLALFAAFLLLLHALPAFANGFKGSLNSTAHLGIALEDQDDANDNDSDDRGGMPRGNGPSANGFMHASEIAQMHMEKKWGTWTWNGGIAGTVTAKSETTLTVKAGNGTSYEVDAGSAKIRIPGDDHTVAAIAVDDRVWVQGTIDGSKVVATLIIDAKKVAPVPTSDDKRQAVVGTVTAQSGTTITIIGSNGTTYTIDAAHATIWKDKKEVTDASEIDVGENVVVQGTLSGSNVAATRIYVVDIPETTANGGIRGTVTAINDSHITLLSTSGTTYSVDTNNADFKDRKGASETWSDVAVGEMVVVHGTVSGSAIDADVVSEVRGGFFSRFGNFFKHFFGKKNG